MGNYTFKGYVTSWDQIHQPVSVLLDHNLRKNSKPSSTKPTQGKDGHGEQRKDQKKAK
jgi:hypothetical protein